MMRDLIARVLSALADWWSFQIGTIESWLDRTPDPVFDTLATEKDQLQRLFPGVDVDGKRSTRRRRRTLGLRDAASAGDSPD